MEKQLDKLLKRLYYYENSYYDAKIDLSLYKEDNISADEQELLHAANWQINNIIELDHDQVVERLIALGKDSRLSWSRIAGEFIASVGGSNKRGGSMLTSYHKAVNIPSHVYIPGDRLACCSVCGLSHMEKHFYHLSFKRWSMHGGRHWGSRPLGAYADLSEAVMLEPVLPSSADIAVFKQLLQFIEEALPEEGPGAFEKRLTKERLVKGHAGIRRDLLQALATVGIIRNSCVEMAPDQWTDYEEVHMSGEKLGSTRGRSDMEMPWAGWNGELDLNRERLEWIFGDYLKG